MTAAMEESSSIDATSSTRRESNDGNNNASVEGASSVQVAVRIRPMLPHEAGNTQCVDVLKTVASSPISTVVRLGGEAGPKFTFDQVFPLSTTQSEVYEHRVAPLVGSCLEGYNATILAYGQTGSGKTHTIMGPSASISAAVQDERQAGVIPRAIRSIFDQLDGFTGEEGSEEERSSSSYDYCVRVQFLEVYGQEIRDLLATTQQTTAKLSIRDVGLAEPEVVGASEQKVESAEEALLCLTKGMYRRVTGATSMNETSSRSHAIFSLIVEQQNVVDELDGTPKKRRKSGDDTMERHVQARRSKFNFVDLAGSERQKRTNATGQRLKEGININQGLLVLGNVISALGDPKKQGKTFVPYRDSNLTRLLKGSLGGNHKTLMIACVSPASNNMEESLNCLRYANRAKNIQNHAVVNVDATSRLMSELRGKMQLLASDLLKARDGNIQELSIPLDVVEALAKGGDGEALRSQPAYAASPLPIRSSSATKDSSSSTLETYHLAEQENQRLKAENAVYKVKLDTLASTSGAGDDSLGALETALMAKATEYEREIAVLRERIQSNGAGERWKTNFDRTTLEVDVGTFPQDAPGTPKRPSTPRSESPELYRLRAQMFGSMSQAKNLDAEVDAEEKAVADLTSKYLRQNGVDDDAEKFANDVDDDLAFDNEHDTIQLEAEVFELSNSIDAKEELIKKLQASRKKFEDMKDFYEGRLREMEDQLSEKIQEAEKLNEELSKLDKNTSQSQALSEKLKVNQNQVAELKRKQAELTRLSSHATKNESQIARLTNEVTDMKHKKVELQRQITNERKSHAQEVQKLKKESMQQQKELNKVKQQKQQKTLEAEKAQQVAKVRLDQVMQLKSKYKESEKQLRILTVKRGVMSRAGLDPVMVGRRQTKRQLAEKRGQSTAEQQTEDAINIDGLRDFFDQRVADVGRREALAEKLAQEWEDHLDLSSQREDIVRNGSDGVNDDDVQDVIASLDSRIKYKEDRIRQLASRLGKPMKAEEAESRDDETFLFSREFKKHVGNSAPMSATKVAAKVLFGMVVRERRRIAALARTASSLDEKVQESERAVAEKESAFRAYVDEQRLEAAEMAEQQQQHILSLMNMVKEEPGSGELSSPVRSAKARHAEKANSKLLLLANERIAVLENQLGELQLGRDAVQKHRDRENDARTQLEEKNRECEDLEQELNDLRSAMRQIREQVTVYEDFEVNDGNDEQKHLSKAVLGIVVNSLHPRIISPDALSGRRRRSSLQRDIPDSPRISIRRQTDFGHTSDSDEVPDWADDIMKDLEIIAKGEMPSSLMESPSIVHAEAEFENPSVFDRLNDPESFTGVQKRRTNGKKATKKGKPETVSSSSVIEGQKQRKMMSRQIATNLDKLTVPGGDSTATDSNRRTSKETGKGRSVFDRLLSPSNLTGTQKHRFHDTKDKRDSDRVSDEHQGEEKGKFFAGHDSTTSREADHMLNDILDGTGDEKNFAKGKGVAKPKSNRKRQEYKELDVFERLNKTTTEAYAVKQHVNIAEKMLDDLLDETKEKEETLQPKIEFHNERTEAYTRQDVFERLQKTTTRAYAVKQTGTLSIDRGEDDAVSPALAASIVKSLDAVLGPEQTSHEIAKVQDADRKMLDKLLDENSSSGETSVSDGVSPIANRLRPRQKAIAGVDVFERLQTTTTEAFDMKVSSSADQ